MLVTCMTRMERRSTPVQHSLVRNIIGTVIIVTRPKPKAGLQLVRPMMGSLGQDLVRAGIFQNKFQSYSRDCTFTVVIQSHLEETVVLDV